MGLYVYLGQKQVPRADLLNFVGRDTIASLPLHYRKSEEVREREQL